MIELRWVEFGPNKQLEYRQREFRQSTWSSRENGYGPWSDWSIVQTVTGDGAALEDLIASGGIAGDHS